jgi:hypothetical protein
MAELIQVDPGRDLHDQLFIILKNGNNKGEFFVKGYNDIKFQFEMFTGMVNPASVERKKDLNIIYNPVLFGHIIAAAADVMGLLAKHELLLGLKRQEDPAINAIIDKSGIEMAKSVKELNYAVNKACFEILELTKPPRRFFPSLNTNASVGAGSENQLRAKVYTVLRNIKHIHSNEKAMNALEEIESARVSRSAVPSNRS